MRKKGVTGFFIGVMVVAVILAALFLFSYIPGSVTSETDVESVEVSGELWMSIELTDVISGENFTIGQFSDRPVLLESFAVWCPTCTNQQNKIKDLHEELGESFVSISLDTDPNEDAVFVAEHVKRNGFFWRYAVSPPELTQKLIDLFGIGIVNAPSAPVILICDDGRARQLDRGVKSVEVLEKEIRRGC